MIVAVFNPKGGVGKTTTAVNLAASFAARGRSVVLVDLEADMNASISLGVRPTDGGPSIADVLTHDKRPGDAVRVVPGLDNLHLITGAPALAYMDASTQEEAKKWEGSLRNNLGYAHHLAGRYDEALVQFRLSLAAHERNGRAANVRIAHWMIARTLRLQGKVQEAIAIQLRLEREWNEAGDPDPYVYEELEKLYRDAGNADLAEAYVAKLRASRPAQ